MNRIVRFLTILSQQKDLLLIIVFATILLMMVLPLPTLLMDFLIALNISASIVIMLMTLRLHSPVQFSTFPSILLITTLFRLAISISTTRLILTEGDAGRIVETFGNVVVSGNLVVGFVIFMIITVVQFLVITKGADRVAEVGARFTLDGMPGKQMSVDADVRAGTMDQIDAREARENNEREAKLFGAMDGAMKFVKGDAVAGLVITAINLIGGIGIGMAQLGYGFSEALNLYALMTIGDGLVAQIPALLISVSAGTIVTRVTNPRGVDLGTEIGEQVTANSRTVIIAGVVIALFGFIPGFPTIMFIALGASISGSVIWSMRRKKAAEQNSYHDWTAMQRLNDEICDDQEARTGTPASLVLVLPRIITTIDPQRFFLLFTDVNVNMGTDFGVPMGNWRYRVEDTPEHGYKVYLHDDLVSEGRIRPECVFVKANASYLGALDIPYFQHFGVKEGVLVHEDHLPLLQNEGIPYWDMMDQIVMDLKRALVTNMGNLVGFQATSNLLDQMARTNPALISDLRENLSVNQVSAVLKLLLEERIPMTSQMRIFEAILNYAPKRPDPQYVLQQVRLAIGDFITNRFAPDGFLPVIIIAPTLEGYIREGFRSSDGESYLIIDNQISKLIAKRVEDLAQDGFKRGADPVLLTQQDIRRALHNILHEHGIYVPVLAYQEILPQTIVYPVTFIRPESVSD